MHRFLLHNGVIRDARERFLSPGQVGLLNGWGVFSTLRVADGVLFAYDRHFARMQRDAQLMQVPFFADPAELQSQLLELVAANDALNATLRVAVVRNRGGIWEGPGIDHDFEVIAFTTDLTRWGTSARLVLIPQARHAASPFSGTKILSWSQNLTWYERAHQEGYDEALLLNERGEVSECTSANVFAVFGEQVVTPPLSAGCLPGITREVLLQEIRVPGIRIEEQVLTPTDLEAADEVFITSSTRGMMAVAEVQGLAIRQTGTVRSRLQNAFDEFLTEYTAANRHVVAGSPVER